MTTNARILRASSFLEAEMSDEYPKALYRGDTESYVHVIADGEDHEQHLREEGYVNYSELKKPEIVVVGKVSGSSGELEKFQKELLEALNANQELEEQLSIAQEQFDSQLKNLQTEKEKLEDELKSITPSSGVPQDVYDAVYKEREQLRKENDHLKYSAMSAEELKTVLDGKGIKYGSRIEKPALVKLVFESLYPKEGE